MGYPIPQLVASAPAPSPPHGHTAARPYTNSRSAPRHKWRVLPIFLLLACALPLAGEELRPEHLEHLGVEDGLSHSSVFSIHQDSRGFLWIATESYLQRYDGYEFKAYKHDPDDPDSPSESQVMILYEDPLDRLWMGTRHAGVDLYDREADRFVHFSPDPSDPHRLIPGIVLALAGDRDGTIWAGTINGLNRLDPASGRVTRFQHDPEESTSLSHNLIIALLVDRQGELWIATIAGLNRLDRDSGTFIHYLHDDTNPTSLSSNDISALFEDAAGGLWVGTWDGILHHHQHERTFVRYDPAPGVAGGRGIQRLGEDGAGHLWLGTRARGLYRFDRELETFAHLGHDPNDRSSLSSNSVSDLLEDRSGILWIATEAGIDRLVRGREQFSILRHHPGRDDSLPGNHVMALGEDEEGLLWIGTMENGITAFDAERRRFLPLKEKGSGLPRAAIKTILTDRSRRLWVGTSTGLGWLDTSRGRFEPFPAVPSEVLSLLEGAAGTLWAGTTQGLYRVERADGSAEHFSHSPDEVESFAANKIYDLLEDPPHHLWLATEGGLDHFDTTSFSYHRMRHEPGNPQGPASNNLVALHRDQAGALWIGSYGGGLSRWNTENSDTESGTWRHFREKDGLANDKVVGILEAEDGALWVSTNGGLSHFDPRTETFRNYDMEDGLHGNVFFIGSALLSSTGEMFFGGPGGITAFYPERIVADKNLPPVVITELRLESEPAQLAREGVDSPLEQAITETRKLVFSHRHRTFSFEFAALHFASPRKNRYAYRLEGYDQDWIHTDASRRLARYTNLDAGTYLFRVKGSNKDGVWNQEGTSIRIVVLPPPWKTWWAYMLYLLAMAMAMLGYFSWQHRRLANERSINARLREVDRLKDEFLANTSHELRTPLQGITGLAESLIDGVRGELPEAARSDLSLLVTSGQRLASLVDDILDFSKLQHGGLVLTLKPVDLRSLVEVVLTLLGPLAGQHDLDLVNDIPQDMPPVVADEQRLLQILHNLVGNAIKFTDAGRVAVTAAVEGDRGVVCVSDTGIGIPAEEQVSVFQAFAQARTTAERSAGGTGLGLAVTRRLVELQNGRIWVESTPGEGARFSFSLPLASVEVESSPTPDHDATALSVVNPALASNGDPPRGQPSQPAHGTALGATDAKGGGAAAGAIRVLVVDDEPVNRQVLQNFLSSERFETTVAADGQEALRLLEEQATDLVLLDIMMPKMSGYEVCRILRERYSIEELPILFLTAKSQSGDVVFGLGLGANDYLVKPISKNELLARVRPHLDLLEIYRNLEELVEAKMSQIKVLRGLLPICSSCKKIRDDGGYWREVETFINRHSEAEFSHGLCPECTDELYGDLPPKG